jgi:hypothetical protein
MDSQHQHQPPGGTVSDSPSCSVLRKRVFRCSCGRFPGCHHYRMGIDSHRMGIDSQLDSPFH